jgi:hypothetical protein
MKSYKERGGMGMRRREGREEGRNGGMERRGRTKGG